MLYTICNYKLLRLLEAPKALDEGEWVRNLPPTCNYKIKRKSFGTLVERKNRRCQQNFRTILLFLTIYLWWVVVSYPKITIPLPRTNE